MKRSALGLPFVAAIGAAWLGCSQILDFDGLIGVGNGDAAQTAETGSLDATPTVDGSGPGPDGGCPREAFFCDGFEDGILTSKWGSRTGGDRIFLDTAIFASERQSVRVDLLDAGSSRTAFLERDVSPDASDRFSTSFSMRISGVTDTDRHLVQWSMKKSNDPGYPNPTVRLMFRTDNTLALVYQVQPSQPGQDLIDQAVVQPRPAANEWHRYRVEIDLVAKKARGFFDDVGVAELTLPANVYTPSQVVFRLGTTYARDAGPVQLWFDDVVMTTP